MKNKVNSTILLGRDLNHLHEIHSCTEDFRRKTSHGITLGIHDFVMVTLLMLPVKAGSEPKKPLASKR